MLARPSIKHILIAKNIENIFDRFLKGKTCKAIGEPDVFLDDKNNLIPDVVILCDRSKLKEQGIYGAPDLVVEILSPSTAKKDLGEKKILYGKYGVKEYWTIDPDSKSITVNYLNGDILEFNNIYIYRTQEELKDMKNDDRKAIVASFKVSLFDDFVIDLEKVFEDIGT